MSFCLVFSSISLFFFFAFCMLQWHAAFGKTVYLFNYWLKWCYLANRNNNNNKNAIKLITIQSRRILIQFFHLLLRFFAYSNWLWVKVTRKTQIKRLRGTKKKNPKAITVASCLPLIFVPFYHCSSVLRRKINNFFLRYFCWLVQWLHTNCFFRSSAVDSCVSISFHSAFECFFTKSYWIIDGLNVFGVFKQFLLLFFSVFFFGNGGVVVLTMNTKCRASASAMWLLKTSDRDFFACI